MKNLLEIIEKPEQFEQFRGMYGINAAYGRTLTTRNTKDVFLCSSKDWLKANCCHWYLTHDYRIINQSGIYYETYVGITTQRKEQVTDKLDFCRYNYEEPGYVRPIKQPKPKRKPKATPKELVPGDESGQPSV